MARFSNVVGAALALAAMTACSVPTDIPVIDSRWVFEVKSTTIGVEGLLPPGVSVSGGEFAVEVDPVTAQSTLGDLCPECARAAGRRVPKPAFTGSIAATATLPSDVHSVQLASGRIALSLVHGFDFDPLRPPGGQPGRLTVTLTEAGGRELGRLALNGATDSLPAHTTVEREITLGPGTIGNELSMEIELDSPAGSLEAQHFVDLALDGEVRARITPQRLRVSAAHVVAQGRRVTIQPADIGVDGVDGAIVDRIQSGAVVLDIANPFGVGIEAEMRITRDGETVVSKDFVVSADARSTASLAMTAEEFARYLGQPGVALEGSGVVTSASAGGVVVVAPDMEVAIGGRVDLVLRVGG